jgi:hypothetical protein
MSSNVLKMMPNFYNSTNLDRKILSYETMIEKICCMYPNIPRRVLHWSKAGFYLSLYKLFLKKEDIITVALSFGLCPFSGSN